jgi:LPS export ABC transporter protein LptC
MAAHTIRLIIKAAACMVCCFIFCACENDINEVKALTEKKISVEEGLNIEAFLSQQGRVKARLTSPLMKRYQADSPYVEFPKTLHVDFYTDSLVIESQLKANYGRYKENEHKVLLRDSVVVFNSKHDTLWCRELWWDQHSEQFYTDKPVRIRQPDKMIYGQGLTAAQNFSWYTLKSVTGIVQVPKEGLP